MIMSIQFDSKLIPFAIILIIPVSFIGSFLLIEITRQPLNLSYFIGLITLIGVSVNNGIVLIDYINKLRKTGMDRESAIFEAVRLRIRPIMLTALTSIIALIPISLGIGIGSKINQSLAICVIGGLIVNTISIPNLLPVIFVLLEDRFKKR